MSLNKDDNLSTGDFSGLQLLTEREYMWKMKGGSLSLHAHPAEPSHCKHHRRHWFGCGSV